MTTQRKNSQFYTALFATGFLGLLALVGNRTEATAASNILADTNETTTHRTGRADNAEWLLVETFNPDFSLEQVRILTSNFRAP